jgi:hypothetical protein
MPTIRLINQSAKIADADLAEIAAACQEQVKNDLCPAWGIGEISVVAGGDMDPADWVITLGDETDDQALGYHSDMTVPFGWIGVAEILGYGGSIRTAVDGNPAVSSVISHEICELTIDPLASLYMPKADGTQVALEVADPVQEAAYQIQGIDVSNFVRPAWFIPRPGGAVDRLGLLNAPLALLPGGYAIIKAADGSVSQTFGERPPGAFWAARAKRKLSRGARRLPAVAHSESLPMVAVP